MKKVGIVYHPLNKGTHSLAQKLAGFLDASGVSCWLCSAWEGDEVRKQVPGTELVLTIGGDGTILQAAQAVVPHSIPITGINLGKLGFLTELDADEARDKLPALLAGEGWIDERALLEVELADGDKKQETPKLFYALNDAVVARGEIARMIYVEASIDGEPLTTYGADGVIVATATGSTGYSLAAGGPVLHPQADEFLLVPIMPHLSLNYSLVLPPECVVRLRVNAGQRAALSIDGHICLPLDDGAAIKVKHSSVKTKFLRIQPKVSFYSTLEQKLRG
jgi:NAD+ kinase